MAINKVVYNGGTLIDLTGDTVTSNSLLEGYTAHDRTGEIIIGTATGGSGDGYVWQDGDGYVHLSDEEGTQISVEQLNVNASGTYTAPSGTAYSPVVVPSGTAGTPTATKGSVSNHSVSVTPSVTNSTGFISGGTKSGTAVSVSASELVSGTKSISSNGTGIDVTNYASIDVAVPTGSATLVTKNITANGTYNASSDNADGYSSVTVNVSGGGGSNWQLLASEELTISTSSTSATKQGAIQLPSLLSSNEILWVHIRDKAGKRNGYFYGSDAIWFFTNGERPTSANPPTYNIKYNNDSYTVSNGVTGVYAYNINSSLEVTIYSKASNSLTIDGTFKCDIYKLSGLTIFE